MTTARSLPTIRDVARVAGTSTAVVSYVLNDGPRPVSAATRERVLDAVEQLGYRQNRMAKALRARRTGVVGLLVPDPANAYFAQLGKAVETAASERGLQLLFAAGGFAGDREAAALRSFVELRVDGLLVVPAGEPDRSLDTMSKSGMPSAVLHRRVVRAGIPTITSDDLAAGRTATAHLLEHGHQRIGCLSGPEAGSPIANRTTGYRTALRDAGHAPAKADIVTCPYGAPIGEQFEAARTLLTSRRRLSAVVACTDEAALAVLRAAAELGRRVPADLAVVTIDGTQRCETSVPSLTAVTVDFAALADHALQTVGHATGLGEQIEIPMTLQPRESCGCTALTRR